MTRAVGFGVLKVKSTLVRPIESVVDVNLNLSPSTVQDVSSFMSAPKPCSSCQSVCLNCMSGNSIVIRQTTTVVELDRA